jgi:hypothetical protein
VLLLSTSKALKFILSERPGGTERFGEKENLLPLPEIDF